MAKIKLALEMDKPIVCGKCFFYKTSSYQCHNESGLECDCKLGFMKGEDMRDMSYEHSMYPKCQLKDGTVINLDASKILKII